MLEVRGPIGGWFVWDGASPALLLGGGFGVVPFISMLRTAAQLGRPDLLRTAVVQPHARRPAVRRRADRGRRPHRADPGAVRHPPAARLTAADLIPLWEPGQTAYVCGSASFAQGAGDLLVGMGVPPPSIRVEQFGPTGAG